MKKILKNKSILLTRSFDELKNESSLLKSFGANVICFPAIKIDYLENSEKIRNVLKNEIDVIIFSSVNSVKYFLQNIGNNKSLVPSNTKIYAVGEQTAKYCKNENLIPEALPKNFSAKGLLELFKGSSFDNIKILFPCSIKARSELPEGLKKLGAEVFQIPVYMVKTNTKNNLTNELKLLENKVDVFGFTSPSNFAGFIEVNKIVDPKKYFSNSLVAAIGKTTEKAINNFNVDVDIIPDKYTINDLALAIINYFDQEELT